MKSIWIGTGCSHHNLPSLSNTATRSSTGTGSEPSSPLAAATNSKIACLAGPSRQLDSAPAFPQARAQLSRSCSYRSRYDEDQASASARPAPASLLHLRKRR